MQKSFSRNRPVVVAPEVLLDAGLSLADLGLYAKIEYLLLGVGSRQADVDDSDEELTVNDVVQGLLDGKAGVIPQATAEELRAGIYRLVAAELYDL